MITRSRLEVDLEEVNDLLTAAAAEDGAWQPWPEEMANGASNSSTDREPATFVRTPGPICNAEIEHVDGERIVTPLSMERILASVSAATDGWPRRVGDALFVHAAGQQVNWLNGADALCGWLGSTTGAPPQFTRAERCHSAAHVFHELRRLAQQYAAVETLPHEPPMQGHYYACDWPRAGDGSALRALVDRYCPSTSIDADLITGMFATVFWGGAAGARPAYLIDSDAGRGAGKSTLAGHVAYLAGGAIELSANEDAGVMKQRLLSPEGMTKRVALLDNVKSLRFSWAEFESLITTSTISGKRLYVGEGQRPNNLLWLITLNGASLAKDLAQRCVIVKLDKPSRSATWAEETRAYIDAHREDIIGDCLALLRSARTRLKHYSRWAAWEHDVLSRLAEPTDAQSVIRERQAVADVEDEEAGLVQDYVADRLRQCQYSPEHDRVFLPSSLVTDWYCRATNDKASAAAVSRRLKQAIREGTVKLITENRCNSYGRGFVWWGPASQLDDPIKTDIQTRLSFQP